MGFFDMISKAVQEGKAKAEFEAAEFSRKIEMADLSSACMLAIKEFKSASLPMKSSLNRIIRQRIEATDSTNDLYLAFENTYHWARRRNDNYALNVSQWIGRKLYNMNDYRVETRGDSEKPLYVPRNS